MIKVDKNKVKIIIAIVLIIAACGLLVYGISNFVKFQQSAKCQVFKERKEASVEMDVSLDLLIDKGMEYGDSVELTFSNGFKIDNVPLLDADYVNPGTYVLQTKNSRSPLIFHIQGERDTWSKLNLSSYDTVNIILDEKGKYKDLYEEHSDHIMENSLKEEAKMSSFDFQKIEGGLLKDNFFTEVKAPLLVMS